VGSVEAAEAGAAVAGLKGEGERHEGGL
jgi:hypothetical protein